MIIAMKYDGNKFGLIKKIINHNFKI